MQQLSFFSESGQSKALPKELLEYIPGFIAPKESDYLLNKLIAYTPWKQQIRNLYDKEVVTPRLTAWYGDPDAFDYSVLGKSIPLHWTDDLLYIKSKIEPLAGVTFNSVLLNYYRDGRDSVAWHSDKEHVLGRNPVIASVSFGQVRAFDIRNKDDHHQKYTVKLEHGSYLLMKAGLQENWEHRVAKSTLSMAARINLTFRVVLPGKHL